MSEDLHPVRSTGIGSWPGADIGDAIKIAFAECPDLPYLPELPARGAYAGLVGRSTALLAGLAVDLQPAGWRLADASGREHRLALNTLRSDLDQLEEQAQGYAGPVKYAVAGPWTLAATLERPRGDRVLADRGARRDLGQSLAEGLAELLAELRRRLPDAEPVVQLDEPLLPAVLAGGVATASGLSRHRVVEPPEASTALRYVVERMTDTRVLVHCCAAEPPVALLQGAGVGGVLLDTDQLNGAAWDAVGTALDAGLDIGLGVLPTNAAQLTPDQVARRVMDVVRDLGIDPARSGQLILTPACGLAGATSADAVRALRTVRTAADIVTEQLAS
ncbi:MAG TPA: methionine synthase [Propionibacteriaceae bacterium]|nr:methionine synthase [Propionibacteriaceae bacterium]